MKWKVRVEVGGRLLKIARFNATQEEMEDLKTIMNLACWGNALDVAITLDEPRVLPVEAVRGKNL